MSNPCVEKYFEMPINRQNPHVQNGFFNELIRRNIQIITKAYVPRKDIIDKLNTNLHDKQMAFKHDPARKKLAVCSRQAGKTWDIADMLLDAAEKTPNSFNPYITLTLKSGKRIIWDILRELNEFYAIGAKPNEAELIMTLPNNARIFLGGCETESEIRKWRGTPYKLACIDEAAFLGDYLKALVVEVLRPSMIKHQGSIVMIGNPNPRCEGYFYEASTDPSLGWSVHHWNILDNPYLPNAAQELEDIKKENGWTDDNPIYQREYLGNWVKDLQSLVYQFLTDKNCVDTKIQYQLTTLGIDIGFFPDTTAFAIIGHTANSKKAQLVHSFERNNLTVTQLAHIIRSLIEQFNPYSIVADTGALGKMIGETLIHEHSIPIKSAEKKDKLVHQAVMNDDFRKGDFTIYKPTNKDFINQAKLLMRDPKGLIDDPRCKNNLCDAVLYAHRDCKSRMTRTEPDRVNRYASKWGDEMEKREAERLERKKTGNNFTFDSEQ